MSKIHSVVFDTNLRLWWEPQENHPTGTIYTVWQDGHSVATTSKTHFSVGALTPETAYTFRLTAHIGGQEEFIGECNVMTAPQKHRIDVTKAPYFAVGDGKTVNTKALQKALDDCREDEAVYLPSGVFLSGSLRMHSDSELYVEKGATLQGTAEPDDYLPKIPSRFEGIHRECYAGLINIGHLDPGSGPNCRNVVIRGGGTVYGGGRLLAERVIEKERIRLADYIASLGDKVKECENNNTIPGRARPRLINMSNAENVVLADLCVGYGACWNIHMIYSRDILTCGCTFRSEQVWNGDGWDPDSSESCTIFDCDFYTGDDAVAIKSGKNPEGNVVARPAKHIRVFDCRSMAGHGITVGSEMSGGVEDVFIWDCDMMRSTFGIEIKGTRKRGGYVRNIRVRNCSMPRVMMHSVRYNDDGEGAPTVPVFEDCVFENIYLTGCAKKADETVFCNALELLGFDQPGHEIRRVIFRDLTVEGDLDAPACIALALCQGLTLENIVTKPRQAHQ